MARGIPYRRRFDFCRTRALRTFQGRCAVSGLADAADGLHAIVLAAGASTRFGSAKQLVRVAGRPLLHTAVARAAEVAGTAVTVVLGARAAELTHLLTHSQSSVVINREWREGMASSI